MGEPIIIWPPGCGNFAPGDWLIGLRFLWDGRLRFGVLRRILHLRSHGLRGLLLDGLLLGVRSGAGDLPVVVPPF